MATRRRRATPQMLEVDAEFRENLAMLVMMWANAESWLHRVLAVLLKIDVTRAELVYSSSASTRARAELVERAGIMCLSDVRRVRHLQRLIQDFKAVSRLRNKLCHAEYDIDASGMAATGIVSTDFQRNDFDGTNYREYRTIDRGLVNEMRQAHRKAAQLCERLERFVKRASAYVLDQPRDMPLPPKKRRKATEHPRQRRAR